MTNRQKPYINMFMGIASQERNPKTACKIQSRNDTNNTLEEDLFMNKAELVAAMLTKLNYQRRTLKRL